ncbi:MAG: NAD-dependent epimerase/dehydratase family protein, partial [Methylophilus sp.]
LNSLLKERVEIVSLTRNKTRLHNISNSIRVIEFDLNKLEENCFKQIGSPDVLIHLAWDGLTNYKSLHHFETELPKQYAFLKAAICSGVKSVFVAGTCLEYGMQLGELGADSITLPNTSYGFAKDSLRKQLTFLKNEHHFQLTWARLFYTYGEGQASNSLYSQLKSAVERGDKVFNMSGGEQIRDFLQIEELSDQIVRLALSKTEIGCTNICSGRPIAIKDLVKDIITTNNWNIELNLGYYPYPDYEPMEFWGAKSDYLEQQ